MSWLHKRDTEGKREKGCGERPESQTEKKRCRRSGERGGLREV